MWMSRRLTNNRCKWVLLWRSRRIWFRDLPLLAMIHGAIVATDAGTTPAGMAMALAYEHALGKHTTVATSGVWTSQEAEALTLLLYAWEPVSLWGVYWVVLNAESTVGALRTYLEGGQYDDGVHHLYAQTLGAECLAPTLRST